jgi:16S rRNA (cytosine967-C5)-methyltransferase
MSPEAILTARNAAWKTLNKCDIFRHDTADVLNRLLVRTDRPAQATDIVYGVIRNRNTLDHILTKCATIDPARVKRPQWNLLRMGVYELVYCPDTADYAIINETVDLAAHKSSKKAAGFVNAVLRNVQRNIADRDARSNTANRRQLVSHTPEAGCLFNIDLLPDPNKEPIQHFSVAFSIPQALVREWLSAYGPEQTRAICIASNRQPSVIVQPNTLRTTAEELAEQLSQEAVSNERVGDSVRVRGAGKLNKTSVYLNGSFYVQDPTAAEAISLLNPQPGWTVLDLCAAPGGKSIKLALLTQDTGQILASDADSKRLHRIRENVKRLRLQSVEILPYNRVEQGVQKQKQLDAIVLDVPCSNTGVLARRVEARWRWKPEAVKNLQKIQQGLLQKAGDWTRPQTKVLYSTCSIQPDENQQQIRQFLADHPQFVLLDEKLTFPALGNGDKPDRDGGYAAVLQKK